MVPPRPFLYRRLSVTVSAPQGRSRRARAAERRFANFVTCSIKTHQFTRTCTCTCTLYIHTSTIPDLCRMVYSAYVKKRIIVYDTERYNPPAIQKLLLEEGFVTTRQGIARFLKVYKTTGTIDRCPGSGRPAKASEEVRVIVEQQMRQDDEATAVQLHRLLVDKGYALSLSTILRCR